jgi:hypothetical protein
MRLDKTSHYERLHAQSNYVARELRVLATGWRQINSSVTHITCIQDAISLNLGWHIGYSDIK